MEDILDLIALALKGVGAEEAGKLGRKLRGRVNDKVNGSDPLYDNAVVEVVDAFVEGLADDSATSAVA